MPDSRHQLDVAEILAVEHTTLHLTLVKVTSSTQVALLM